MEKLTVYRLTNKLRASWRLLFYAVLVLAPLFIFLISLSRYSYYFSTAPRGIIIFKGFVAIIVILAAWIMSKVEKIPLSTYGFPFKQAFGLRFWQGAFYGALSLSGLLGLMYITGSFRINSAALSGKSILFFASIWALASVCTALAEEFSTRGYALFNLASGIGFWPAAIITSLFFGLLHLYNPGESVLSIFILTIYGMFLSFTLRRTGTLWFAVGFHAAWNWAEGFIYGTPVSGNAEPGHLFNSSFYGSKLLSGGSNGPEGSILMIPIFILTFVVFYFWFRPVKYS